MKYLVSNNIDSFAAGVPEELASQEPGLSQLAAAVEAYRWERFRVGPGPLGHTPAGSCLDVSHERAEVVVQSPPGGCGRLVGQMRPAAVPLLPLLLPARQLRHGLAAWLRCGHSWLGHPPFLARLRSLQSLFPHCGPGSQAHSLSQ